MKLISPEFLRKINDTWHREKVLLALFKEEEVVSIVMVEKKINFDEACEWISRLCHGSEAPEANEAEKIIMRRIAKQFLDEWRESNDNTTTNVVQPRIQDGQNA